MKKSLLRAALLSMICLTVALLHGQSGATPADDAFLSLDEGEGPRTLAWAQAEKERKLDAPQPDSPYDRSYRDALTTLQAKHPIPSVSLERQGLETFWQDESHVRPIWGHTTLESYGSQDPRRETILDIVAENKSWVYKGHSCLARRCLVKISDGGGDAVSILEFDSEAKSFGANGFELSEGEQSVGWLGCDTVLAERDWGEGTTTEAGHAFVFRELKRAQPFDQAREVFRGRCTDLGIAPLLFGERRIAVTRVVCWTNGSGRQYALFEPAGPIELDSPKKAPIVEIASGRLLVTMNEDCIRLGYTSFKTGSMISCDLVEWKQDPLRAKRPVVFQPKCRQALPRFGGPRNFPPLLTCQSRHSSVNT
ncbi:hypothetical protein [Bradyrhizobium sp. CCBAU 65884]|uniref:hypothetical protein n=1 Tax=Bradyrhizobium sp. CCBAU 65884 TaxID=722477 RepID=UPI00230504C5|nr:hypothetical protein [Bradyrhizobium sp. CCBAU 65884]